MKKMSIGDIANQLNISKTTVSFILNNRAQEMRISEQLVKRVEQFIKEVDYKPNPIAQSLRTGKTKIIGLMVENIADPFFSAIARHIENKAYKSGYKIIYCSTDNDRDKTIEFLDMFKDRNVDGCIIAPPVGVESEIQSLINAGMPVVFFDRHLPEIETDFVEVNNYESIQKATNMLIKNGYQQIGFITFASSQSQMMGRLEGYLTAVKATGRQPYLLEIQFNPDEKVMIQAIKRFLKSHPQLDAVIFSAIQAGTNGLKAFQQLGLRVHTDIAVIAFDDCDLFELYAPSITAISQPIEQIAESAIDLLLKRLNQHKKTKTTAHKKMIVKTTMQLRNSSIRH